MLAVICLAGSLMLSVLVAPAAARPYGAEAFPGDLTLLHGDVVLGDLQVGGTLTIPSGVRVPIGSTDTVTLTAARIVIAGTLDGSGVGDRSGGGDGLAQGSTSCGGGGGGGYAAPGGSGGAGALVNDGTGGLGGPAVMGGPGRKGGDGASCGTRPGGQGGPGGASIHLVAPVIEISGTVRADGTHGTGGSVDVTGAASGGGGGGSGGEIWLSGTTVLSGTLSAVGGWGGNGGGVDTAGRGGGGGGGGSGGRIHIDGGPLIGRSGHVLNADQRALGGRADGAQVGGLGGLGQVPTVTSPIATTVAVSSSLDSSTVGQTVEFTAAVTPSTATGTVTFSADGSAVMGCDDVAVTSGTAVCPTAALRAGTYAIEAAFTPSDPLYDPSSAGLEQRVREAALPQRITFPAQSDRIVGEAPFPLVGVAGGESGNPVTFTSAGPCSVTAGTVTPAGVGTCTITADQAGSDGYEPAPSVSQSFAVGYGQRVLSLSVSSVRGGAVVVVLRLTDAGGRNLSAVDVPVRATAIDGGSLEQVLTLDPAKNFRYSPILGSYTFTAYVRTGLTRGQHTLSFTAGADPRPHAVTFTTR